MLAIRGMIRLRLGHAFSAVDDFREMLRLREGGSALEIADARMHLGEGYLFLAGKLREGRDLLRESVGTYARYPDNPNLPRARRKLARAYLLNRQIGLYRRTKAEAAQDALRIGALDQIRE
jgi:hypothetical protein